jgi:uncharacterized protein YbjT (DUF2867 family)
LVDEVVRAEVTLPETLAGVCEGIDVVFSSVGITRQKGRLTFKDVDYRGNQNLLEVALKAGVQKFVYVSVFNGRNMLDLAIVKAHEDFVEALKSSGMDHAVIRPTGFFSDMEEYLKMAKRGRVYLIGSGRNRINPIHGADLAVTCVEAVSGTAKEIDVGGPEVLSHREIAEIALRCSGKKPRISTVPVWIMRSVVAFTRLFNRHQGELLAFFTRAMSSEAVAPATGIHRLEDQLKDLAKRNSS